MSLYIIKNSIQINCFWCSFFDLKYSASRSNCELPLSSESNNSSDSSSSGSPRFIKSLVQANDEFQNGTNHGCEDRIQTLTKFDDRLPSSVSLSTRWASHPIPFNNTSKNMNPLTPQLAFLSPVPRL